MNNLRISAAPREVLMGAYATRLVRRYVRFAHAHGFTPVARLSVIPLPMVAPLPPSISLRTLREVFRAPRNHIFPDFFFPPLACSYILIKMNVSIDNLYI